MKYHITVFAFLIVGLNVNVQAQKIGQIKKKAKSNSQRKSRERRSSGGSGSSRSSGSGSDFNGAACFDVLGACFDLISLIGSSSSSSESQTSTYTPSYTPSTNDNIDPVPVPKEPTVTKEKPVVVQPKPVTVTPTPAVEPIIKPETEHRPYFQLKASYGFVPNNYEVFRPGARVRFGKKHGFGMALDYRYNHLSEKILGERTTYFSHDIQILQFAPETKENVEFRIGFGFMVDEFEEFYPEFLLGFNALADQMRWNFGTEVRIANDFSSSVTPRLEWGTHAQYALINQAKFKLYGGLRTKVANYFGVNIWSIGLGLTMRVY